MFEHAELKISRANKHIEEFNSEVRRYIDENPHTVFIEFDPQHGCDVLKVGAPNKPIPQEIALPIGDAIHNLHTALDFIWYEFVCMFSNPSDHVKFPFRDTRQGVSAALKGRKIPTSFQRIEEFVLDVVKPYEGSDTVMWAFHNLDITDKHEYLIPQLKLISVWNIRAEAEDGSELPLRPVVSVIPGWPAMRFLLIDQQNVKLTDKGKMTANILFGNGPLQAWPVDRALANFVESVSQILEGFRALLVGQEV